jgi:hypothetical protein
VTVDWTRWCEGPETQARLRAEYLETIAKERDAAAARWKRMTPAQQAAWPRV